MCYDVSRKTRKERERNMDRLTLEKAKEINATMVSEEHLILHAGNVSAASCTITIMRSIRRSICSIRKNLCASWGFPRRISGPSCPTGTGSAQTWSR